MLRTVCPAALLTEVLVSASPDGSVIDTMVAARLMGRMRTPAEEALSERENEVLALVARGASNREIAHALHISEAAVKSHLIHIFAKLGVSDRTAAVTTGLERGIIRLET